VPRELLPKPKPPESPPLSPVESSACGFFQFHPAARRFASATGESVHQKPLTEIGQSPATADGRIMGNTDLRRSKSPFSGNSDKAFATIGSSAVHYGVLMPLAQFGKLAAQRRIIQSSAAHAKLIPPVRRHTFANPRVGASHVAASQPPRLAPRKSAL